MTAHLLNLTTYVIKLNSNEIHFNQEALTQLPNNRSLNDLKSVVIEDPISSKAEAVEENDDYLSRSFVLNAAHRRRISAYL